MQDVLSVTQNQIDEEAASKELLETLNLAIDGMLAMRKREGDNLVVSILSKIDSLEGIRGEVVTRAPEVVEAYKQKLSARINEILTSDQREFYDDNRLAAEVAIFADKCAIDEEMARLSSHFSQARKILAEEGPVGKKMDFLVQEINREVNTTGSKANDIEITSRVLSMKNLVEEIREHLGDEPVCPELYNKSGKNMTFKVNGVEHVVEAGSKQKFDDIVLDPAIDNEILVKGKGEYDICFTKGVR